MSGIAFEDSRYYTGPDVTDEMVEHAEAHLGRRLPRAYVETLRARNGGSPVNRRFPTSFATSWAEDHFEVEALRGIGGPWGIDTEGPLSSRSLIEEWGYPAIGIVICDTPSGGHDTVMLDYRQGGDEPAVAYVDEDRTPRVVAATFAEFLDLLEGDPPARDHP